MSFNFHRSSTALTVVLGLSLGLGACGNTDATDIPDKTTAPTDATSSASTADAPTLDASNNNSVETVVTAVNANLKASGIEQTVSSAVPTDMPELYWVTGEGMPPFFTDKTGQFIVQGQVVQIGGAQPVDISAKFQAQMAGDALASIPLADMVIYPAKGDTRAVVYAFTDADCGYCRKLHSEMDDINAQGVEVRYLAWPRSEQTFPKMQAIWCSEDRNQAMNTAKSGGDVSAPNCDSPVQSQFELGASLGVRGTPAIYTDSGQQIGGYVPAKQLAQAAIANK